MKKNRRFVRILISLLSFACFQGVSSAAPYGPKGRETTWTQPGGQSLKLRVFGDDFYARTETLSGHTVIYNSADRTYYYAARDKNGDLKSTGVKAHLAPNASLEKHIDRDETWIRDRYLANRTKLAAERLQRWDQRVQAAQQQKLGNFRAASGINPAVTGKITGLTILVQFPDDSKTSAKDPVNFPVTRGKIERFCNLENYKEDGNTGSVRDYFYDQSLGNLTYVQSVTQIVTLARARNYYNFSNYPTNTQLRDAGEAGRLIIADAAKILKSEGFDFSSLSLDDTNNAIATNVFFAGDDSGVWASGLWPHQWSLATPLNVGTSGSPIRLYNYQITNINDASPVIGTFCHENGHLILDYPDIYDVIGEGVGEHCLMGSGNYLNSGKTPSPINAYFKDIVGWADVRELGSSDYLSKKLPSTGNVSYKYTKPGSTSEFFYVENRGKGDKWAEYSDDTGIAIWHIDSTVNGNIGGDPHYMVALEQADARLDLEKGRNRGDANDLFDINTPLFSDTSSPNAKWWNGKASGLRVKVAGDTGSNIAVQFGKLPPNTILLDSPNGGEVVYRDSTFFINWEANLPGGLKIDLYKKGVFHSQIIGDAPNTGTYQWAVPEDTETGADFTIRLSSVVSPSTVFKASEEPFRITNTSFPENDVMPYGWYVPSGASAGWAVTNSLAYEGSYSLVSKPVGDGRKASIAYTSVFKGGLLTFYMRVSSEAGYDFGTFLLDGVQQTLNTGVPKSGLSGGGAWTFCRISIPSGKHTLQWVYTKDDSYAGGKDAAWIDGVLLPATTQEISVIDNKGSSLTSSATTTVFPDVVIGKQSKAIVFKIKNSGKSDLHGLKVDTKGDDSSQFVVSKLGKTILKPGDSTSFEVLFAPKVVGGKKTTIRVISNDENESPFYISAKGTAVGIPEILVSQPEDRPLKDGVSTADFGIATVGKTGKYKTFTVKNVGTGVLKKLEIARSGSARADFVISNLGVTTLQPGESTTFKVTFSPSAKNDRIAQIKISSSYNRKDTFDVGLKGVGAPKNLTQSSSPALVEAVLGKRAPASAAVASGTVEVGGLRYNSVTFAKDGVDHTVEVSPNLVDWFSGVKHTTIVTDNESYQKVRDNTPLGSGVKRFIRVTNTP